MEKSEIRKMIEELTALLDKEQDATFRESPLLRKYTCFLELISLHPDILPVGVDKVKLANAVGEMAEIERLRESLTRLTESLENRREELEQIVCKYSDRAFMEIEEMPSRYINRYQIMRIKDYIRRYATPS
jgi:hypothetical protein